MDKLKKNYEYINIEYEYGNYKITIQGKTKEKSDVIVDIERKIKYKYASHIIYGTVEEVEKEMKKNYKEWIKEIEKEEKNE